MRIFNERSIWNDLKQQFVIINWFAQIFVNVTGEYDEVHDIFVKWILK